MGIVVTPGQELIAPDRNDPFRNYPLYNGLDMDKIDTYLGSPTVNTYVPVLQQRGGLTGSPDPNLGSTGTTAGFWLRVMNWIYVKASFHFEGTGIVPGADNSGWYSMTLPVASSGVDTEVSTARAACIGKGTMRDNSALTASQTCVVQLLSPIHAMFILESGNPDSRAVRHDEPFVWATGDRLNFTCMYPVVI